MIRPHLHILGKSNIGTRIAMEGLRRGWDISVSTRQKVKSAQIEYLHTPPERLKDDKFWKNISIKPISLLVNSIGGSVSDNGIPLADLNVNIPLTAIKSLTSRFHKVKVLQLSTIAADGLEAPYGKTKREMEETLKELDLEHLTIFRIGDVVSPKIAGQTTDIIKEQHKLSVEELTWFFYTFHIGDKPGQVVMQSVSVDDIAKAAGNLIERTHRYKLINAVSPQVLTQEQFFEFHCDLAGKKYRPWHIPFSAAEKLVKHHPKGHFSDYVIEYCKKGGKIFSHTEFEELLGQKAKTLPECYSKDMKLAFPKPPIGEIALQALKTLWNKPESRQDTLTAIHEIFLKKGKGD